jgi:hypothetical protein
VDKSNPNFYDCYKFVAGFSGIFPLLGNSKTIAPCSYYILYCIFSVDTGMGQKHANLSENIRLAIIAASAILAVGFVFLAPMPAAATVTTTEEPTTTTTTPPPEGLELSPEPVYQERQRTVSETPINQTHVQVTTSGNGTLTLPNTTETISFTSTGSLLTSLDGTAVGNVVITTEDGTESATAKVFGIARFGMEEGRGIITALVNTDSTTGRLAPLDGMILAGQIEFPPEEETASVTLWEWQSGIPLPTTATTTPPPSEELPPLMNDTTTTTTTTNATTTTDAAADTNAATTAAPEEEVGAEGDEQQQQQPQQTTPTIPPPNPLFG